MSVVGRFVNERVGYRSNDSAILRRKARPIRFTSIWSPDRNRPSRGVPTNCDDSSVSISAGYAPSTARSILRQTSIS